MNSLFLRREKVPIGEAGRIGTKILGEFDILLKSLGVLGELLLHFGFKIAEFSREVVILDDVKGVGFFSHWLFLLCFRFFAGRNFFKDRFFARGDLDLFGVVVGQEVADEAVRGALRGERVAEKRGVLDFRLVVVSGEGRAVILVVAEHILPFLRMERPTKRPMMVQKRVAATMVPVFTFFFASSSVMVEMV